MEVTEIYRISYRDLQNIIRMKTNYARMKTNGGTNEDEWVRIKTNVSELRRMIDENRREWIEESIRTPLGVVRA